MAKPLLFFNPKPQYFTNAGEVLNGGKLFVYSPGTTTKMNTYPTAADALAGTNANSNPLVLNSAGRLTVDVYLTGAAKFVMTTSTDTDPPVASIWTEDNVTMLGQLVSVATKTSNYSITAADRDKMFLMDCTAGSRTFTLPLASVAGDGFNIKLKKIDSSSNSMVVARSGSDTIDGSTSISTVAQYDFFEFYSDGTEWYIANSNVLDGSIVTAKLAAGAVTTAKIADNNVTLPKIAQIATGKLLGSTSGSTANVGEVTVSTGLSLSSGVLTLSPTIGVQIFTSSGTYTPTSGMKYCVVELVGGGGAGGSAAGSSAGNGASASGGGGGGYGRKQFSAATIGASQTVTIGAAGAGSSGSNSGGDGGTTSLGALLSATGGSGGPGGGTTASIAARSAGGNGGTCSTSGALQITGGKGSTGWNLASGTLSIGGAGGTSVLGSAGPSVAITSGAATPGAAGGYGSGGGGGANANSGGDSGGAAGGSGIVIVWEIF